MRRRVRYKRINSVRPYSAWTPINHLRSPKLFHFRGVGYVVVRYVMKICCFLLMALLVSVSDQGIASLSASEAKPRNAKKEKKQARLDRKQGETKPSSIGMPAIPKIANAPPVRPDGKLRMEVDQIKTAALWVDRYVGDALNKAGQKPNPPSDDFVFLRRIYLDAVGRIPTDDEASAFL